jgi:hypothetical protein
MARLEKTFVSKVRRTRSSGISEMGPLSVDRGIAHKGVERPAERHLDVALLEHVQLIDDESVPEAELLALSL